VYLWDDKEVLKVALLIDSLLLHGLTNISNSKLVYGMSGLISTNAMPCPIEVIYPLHTRAMSPLNLNSRVYYLV
jgi:hypothetical protein